MKRYIFLLLALCCLTSLASAQGAKAINSDDTKFYAAADGNVVVSLPTSRNANVADVGKTSISGIILYEGEPVVGALVMARSVKVNVTSGTAGSDNGFEGKDTTDENGAFLIKEVPAGPVELSIEAQGIPKRTIEVQVSKGRETSLTIDIGDDVPVGSSGGSRGRSGRRLQRRPNRPSAVSPQESRDDSCEAPHVIDTVEVPAKDDIELKDWLRRKAQEPQRKRLVVIVPLQDGTSLMSFAAAEGDDIDYEVYLVNEPIKASSINMRLSQNPNKTFVGIHRLNASSYLLILY